MPVPHRVHTHTHAHTYIHIHTLWLWLLLLLLVVPLMWMVVYGWSEGGGVAVDQSVALLLSGSNAN